MLTHRNAVVLSPSSEIYSVLPDLFSRGVNFTLIYDDVFVRKFRRAEFFLVDSQHYLHWWEDPAYLYQAKPLPSYLFRSAQTMGGITSVWFQAQNEDPDFDPAEVDLLLQVAGIKVSVKLLNDYLTFIDAELVRLDRIENHLSKPITVRSNVINSRSTLLSTLVHQFILGEETFSPLPNNLDVRLKDIYLSLRDEAVKQIAIGVSYISEPSTIPNGFQIWQLHGSLRMTAPILLKINSEPWTQAFNFSKPTFTDSPFYGYQYQTYMDMPDLLLSGTVYNLSHDYQGNPIPIAYNGFRWAHGWRYSWLNNLYFSALNSERWYAPWFKNFMAIKYAGKVTSGNILVNYTNSLDHVSNSKWLAPYEDYADIMGYVSTVPNTQIAHPSLPEASKSRRHIWFFEGLLPGSMNDPDKLLFYSQETSKFTKGVKGNPIGSYNPFNRYMGQVRLYPTSDRQHHIRNHCSSLFRRNLTCLPDIDFDTIANRPKLYWEEDEWSDWVDQGYPISPGHYPTRYTHWDDSVYYRRSITVELENPANIILPTGTWSFTKTPDAEAYETFKHWYGGSNNPPTQDELTFEIDYTPTTGIPFNYVYTLNINGNNLVEPIAYSGQSQASESETRFSLGGFAPLNSYLFRLRSVNSSTLKDEYHFAFVTQPGNVVNPILLFTVTYDLTQI